MSAMGLAPRMVIDGPLPRPPLFGLTSVAVEVTGGGDDHWRAGANVYPYPDGLPSGFDPCLTGTFREKDVPVEGALPDPFPGFTAYLGEICSSFGIGSWEEWQRRADAAFSAREGWVLERQLVAADYVDAPHLGDDNVTVLASGAAVAAAVAVAYLEDSLSGTGEDGIIHLTPSVAAFLGTTNLVDDRGVKRTMRGTPVAIGGGYVGADVPTPSGIPAASPAAGQSWIYASGPVIYRRDSSIFTNPSSAAEALDRDLNSVIYRAERDMWVAWDGRFQAAVLADWSP